MIDGFCSKRFPKEFISETMAESDGYPFYRRSRPEEGEQSGIKEIRRVDVVMDNRWVVPYSCEMFGCHIKVEICNSIKVSNT